MRIIQVGKKVEKFNINKNSILLKKEDLYAIYEYALDKMIGFILPTDLIIISNWQVTHRL